MILNSSIGERLVTMSYEFYDQNRVFFWSMIWLVWSSNKTDHQFLLVEVNETPSLFVLFKRSVHTLTCLINNRGRSQTNKICLFLTMYLCLVDIRWHNLYHVCIVHMDNLKFIIPLPHWFYTYWYAPCFTLLSGQNLIVCNDETRKKIWCLVYA